MIHFGNTRDTLPVRPGEHPEHTAIGEYAYMGQPFTAFQFPANLESVGKAAFAFCAGLEEAVIPKSVTVIPEALFYCCEHLKKVVFEAAPTFIGAYAFAGCYRLREFVVENVPLTLEELIGRNVAAPYAFFGCGCDIREELKEEDLHATPTYESPCYRQQLLAFQDAQITWNQYCKHDPHWNRRDPEQFLWMPGISEADLTSRLNDLGLQLPREYREVLEQTNGACLFRQMMTLYALPTDGETPWQEEHSLLRLNSHDLRQRSRIPPELYLLGTTDVGIWFGTVSHRGTPAMANFYFQDHSLQVFSRYGDWKAHMEKIYQFEPRFWAFEDQIRKLSEELDRLAREGELLTTDLWDIRAEAENRR